MYLKEIPTKLDGSGVLDAECVITASSVWLRPAPGGRHHRSPDLGFHGQEKE
jgi:hypothetical protein